MPGFCQDNQSDLFDLYDIVARAYGCLPSDIAKLSWGDLFVCLKSCQTRSKRVRAIIRKNKYKKSMVFLVISLADIADLI